MYWEQCKLSDISEKSYEKNTDNKYSTVLTNSAEYGIVKQRDFFDKDIANSSNISGYYIVRKNYFVYNPRISNQAKFGPINRNKLDETGIMSPLYLVFTVHDIDESFLETLFQTTTWHRFMYQNGDTGARADRFAIKDSTFMSMPIKVPPLEEQHKLALAFQKLDHTITLHEGKKKQLESLKSALLQKLFADKSGYPIIRFKGYSDAWEQRKLSECAGFRRGSFPQPYGNKEWYDGDGAMSFVQVADVADDMKLVDDTKQKISKLAQPMSVYADKGSVLVTLQGSIGRVAITQYGAFVDRTVLIFDKYNQDIDKTFWAYIIKEKFIDEARKAPGGTIKTITKEALSDFDLMLPNYDEQKKLGAFLVSIDNLITLHQSKLEKLQKIKKSLLERMFA
ncbi:restriction endonuclease subunit S [Lactobacillus porci]|uniref:Restriction endonuclease subunit S n=1 Tax=Lactobacillus porci TaxID=2012477 RepID=A0A6A8MGN0_9LACO|nr:restriction endonuclease subunit S [Lactobacillus porci]MST87969.1 restriction endonuclease subunit S [Lactobacillus porci]